jgi:bifunctional DNA-binding transcriptional regulator/antitoxin component of YhaV-PrlF toxin-antitoxin module
VCTRTVGQIPNHQVEEKDEERSFSMPQLIKGGKHTFGWSRVGEMGRIVIPTEALVEYGLKGSEKLIMVPGSKTSGGFGLAPQSSLIKSPLGAAIKFRPRLRKFQIPEGEVVEYEGKSYCWVKLRSGGITVPPRTLEKFSINIGDRLLAIRGSGLAIGFAVRGPIIEEAKRHSELEIFEPTSQDTAPD